MSSSPTNHALIQPLWLRIFHWINALAVVLMIMSGWRIFNASPLFDFTFPKGFTIGGWLGGALQWHFAAMWLFALNGSAYLILNLVSGRVKKRFSPLSLIQLMRDMSDAARGRLTHANIHQYNMVQKFAYLSVIIAGIGLVVSGLVLWKSVQFSLLRDLLGGYDAARYIHFILMAFLVVFVLVHIIMVALVPRTLLTMLRGR